MYVHSCLQVCEIANPRQGGKLVSKSKKVSILSNDFPEYQARERELEVEDWREGAHLEARWNVRVQELKHWI